MPPSLEVTSKRDMANCKRQPCFFCRLLGRPAPIVQQWHWAACATSSAPGEQRHGKQQVLALLGAAGTAWKRDWKHVQASPRRHSRSLAEMHPSPKIEHGDSTPGSKTNYCSMKFSESTLLKPTPYIHNSTALLRTPDTCHSGMPRSHSTRTQ